MFMLYKYLSPETFDKCFLSPDYSQAIGKAALYRLSATFSLPDFCSSTCTGDHHNFCVVNRAPENGFGGILGPQDDESLALRNGVQLHDTASVKVVAVSAGR